MKKCKKNRLKLNNAGMTLIELLVAIAIMAVALVPLLFSFVNVAKYNARAREIQQTTTLAHTVMENCKAYSLEEIKDQMTDTTDPQYPFLDGVYASQIDVRGNQMYLTDVVVEDKKYDIMLDFNAHDVGTQSAFEVMETESMNPYLDAVFTPMGTKFHVNFSDGSSAYYTAAQLDQVAYINALQKISDNMKQVTEAALGTGKGITLSTSYIEDSFKDSSNPNYKKFSTSRIMRILIWNPGDHEAVNVYYDYYFKTADEKYYFEYTKEDGTVVPFECEAKYEPEYNTIIYSNSLTNDVTHPTKVENVYFFYYPGYKTVLPDPSNPGAESLFSFDSDEIVVSNQLADGSRQIDVYLIKQKTPAYGDANLSILETSYSTYVDGMYKAPHNSGTNIYHNFDVNLGGGSSTAYNVDSWFDTNLNIMSQLVPTDNKVLMYDITLKIFEAGAYDMDSHLLDSTAEPVLTMEGTTLDW